MHKIPITTDNRNYIHIGNTLIVFNTYTTSGNSGNVAEPVDVAFPIQFSSVPCVQSTARSGAPYTKARNITVANKSVSGFTAYVLRTDDSQQANNYIAIGEKTRDED